MADVAESVTSLEGNFKQQFPEGVPDLIPEGHKFQKQIKFVGSDLELGDSYVQPVRLSYPTGFTHAATGAGAFSLQDAVPGQLRKATVDGYQILLRDQVDMESAAKASRGSKKAFKDIVSVTFEGLQKAMRKRIETEMSAGQMGLGIISSVSGSGTTRAWVITAASWAPGFWSGVESTKLDVYTTPSGSQRNTNATVILTSVNIDTKTLSVSGNATDLSAIVAGDYLFFRGAFGAEQVGIEKVLTNTGTIFNIAASTYSLWQGTSQAVTGALSFNAIKKAVSKAVGKGMEDGAIVYCNPGGWDDVMTDIAALRRTDKSEIRKVEIGAEEIVFYTQAGTCKMIPSIYMKEGICFGLAEGGYWKRVGAQDVSPKMPGFDEKLFHVLPSNAGIEVRYYTNQNLFCDAIGKNFVITGIVNSTAA